MNVIRTLLLISLLTPWAFDTDCGGKNNNNSGNNNNSSDKDKPVWGPWRSLGRGVEVSIKGGTIYRFRNTGNAPVTFTYQLVFDRHNGTTSTSKEMGPVTLDPGLDRKEYDTDFTILRVERVSPID